MNKKTLGLLALAVIGYAFYKRSGRKTAEGVGAAAASSGVLPNGVVFGLPKPQASNAVNPVRVAGAGNPTQSSGVPTVVGGVDISPLVRAGVGAVGAGVSAAWDWTKSIFSGGTSTSSNPLQTTNSDPLVPGVNTGYGDAYDEGEDVPGVNGPYPSSLPLSAQKVKGARAKANRDAKAAKKIERLQRAQVRRN